MKEITKTYRVYSFEELSEEAKEKALEEFADINMDFDWYQSAYDDAEQVGLRIEGFDLDRANNCDLVNTESLEEVADLIVKNHGEGTDTYQDAKKFLKSLGDLNGEEEDFEEKREALEEEFLHNLSEDYLSMLKQEYEHLTSKEAITESIICNEYEFNEDGSHFSS